MSAVACRRWLIVALLLGAGCARKTDYVGRVITSLGPGDAATDSRVDGPGSEGPIDGDGGSEAPAPACEATGAVIPAAGAAPWTCNDRCRREADFVVDPTSFTSAPADPDPTHQPRLVYPLPGSVHPANLPRIALHWQRGPGAGQTAFLIRIAAAAGAPYLLHVGHRAPVGPTPAAEADVVYEVPERVWRTISRDNAGSAVTITVSAYDPVLHLVATSAPLSLRFSGAAVEGGLHFVSTEKQAGINRHVFGTIGAHLLVPKSPTAGPTDCLGCHSASRDGGKLAFAATYAGSLTLVRTSNVGNPIIKPEPPPNEQRGISPALSPDGRLLLARDGVSDDLAVYDAETGVRRSARMRDQLGGRIDYPEWSPDGRWLVATRATQPVQPPQKYAALDGELVVIPLGSNDELGAPAVILSEPDQIHAHPSWSPDGQWIVFVSSAAGTPTHLNPATRLRLLRRSDGAVRTLTAATAGDGNFATYPRFAPVGQDGCQLLFIAFQSRLTYGLLGRRTADLRWPQLWMSAIDLSDPTAPDPSRPPVWLPFQDVQDKNLLPSWSASVPCSSDSVCGGGAVCDPGRGRCVVAPL